MDIGRAFVYFSEDVNWIKKILIGGVLSIIPIVNFAVTGYWLVQTRRVYEGNALPLPEWDNFGEYFTKGLIATVATLIYAIPAFVILCCAFILRAALTGSSQQGGQNNANSAIGFVALCGGCLLTLYFLVLLAIVPALLTRYAITNQFSAFFEFGPAWQLIQSNPANYVIAIIGYVIANFIAGLGVIACFVGVFFTSFWSYLVAAYLFGSFARGASTTVMTPPMASAPT